MVENHFCAFILIELVERSAQVTVCGCGERVSANRFLEYIGRLLERRRGLIGSAGIDLRFPALVVQRSEIDQRLSGFWAQIARPEQSGFRIVVPLQRKIMYS